MSIVSGSLAAGVGVGVKNKVMKASASVLPRKVLVMGSPLAAKVASVALAVPQLLTCPEDAIDRYGAGSMLARLVSAAFRGSNYSVLIYAFPEADGTTAATGSIVVTASTPKAGILSLYVAGVLYPIVTTATDTPATIGDAIAAAITADANCPLSAVAATGTVTFTAKSKGLYGNSISIVVNAWPQNGETLPSGVTATVTAMNAGAGVPTVATDIANGLGSGSSANSEFFADIVHGYGQDATVLAALGAYVGLGNEFSGLYDRNVHRPFRALTGDVAPGSDGLTALIALTASYLNDRCNGVIARPGSMTPPAEIAATAIGEMAASNNKLAEAGYVGLILPGVDPGNLTRMAGNDWTMDYTNRDTAVKAGISPTIVEDGVVKLQNVVSFYRPTSVPVNSNAYRSMRNISILQNMLNSFYVTFRSEKWQQFSIVSDTKNVTNAASRAKARDIDCVKDDLLALIQSFAGNCWIFDPEYSINALKNLDAVTVRAGGDGFINNIPFILSGEGNIIDTIAYVDTSIAVLNA